VRYFAFSCRLGAIFLILCLCLSAGAVSLTAAGQTVVTANDLQSFSILPESSVPVSAPPATNAASYALLDPTSGKLLAEKDADTKRPMASTTKIMTALVVLERCDLAQTVIIPPEAVGVEGSSIYLFAGERITVETLLFALMLSSANDAATALALHTAGSIPDFAALMNQKATELGLSNTHFVNPHGLQAEDHYTTARDLATLTAAALQNTTFAEIVATKRYSVPQQGTGASRLFLNHNRLLRNFEGAVGVKTGFTKASGRCLVSAATRDGLTLIAVTLRDPDDWRDHQALLEWGFSQYIAFAPKPMLSPLPVVGGTAPSVAVKPANAIALTLPAQHPEITCTVELPRFLYAGFAGGTQVGRVIYRMGDDLLFETPLLTENGVPATQARLSLWERIRNLFRK